jgi:hypothetical protein
MKQADPGWTGCNRNKKSPAALAAGDPLAGGPGFEPGLTVPETAVLPLDEPPRCGHFNTATQGCKLSAVGAQPIGRIFDTL